LRTGGQRRRSVQTNQTNNLVFIKHHHQLHIGKNVSDELSILAPQSEDGTHTALRGFLGFPRCMQESIFFSIARNY
jgi:hypothetical protein